MPDLQNNCRDLTTWQSVRKVPLYNSCPAICHIIHWTQNVVIRPNLLSMVAPGFAIRITSSISNNNRVNMRENFPVSMYRRNETSRLAHSKFSSPDDANKHHSPGLRFVMLQPYDLCGTKPLHKPMLTYTQLKHWRSYIFGCGIILLTRLTDTLSFVILSEVK